MQTLVIATHNRKKAGEMVQILSTRFPHLELKTLADYEGAPEPEETGETYADNARIKSESAAAFTGEWSLADDAGLEIDALGGAPGLKSKRFEGEDTPFPVKIAKLLELLEGVPDEARAARFRCCIALTCGSGFQPENDQLPTTAALGPSSEHSDSGGEEFSGWKPEPHRTLVLEAICEGRIAREPSGAGGFGYDPIFFLPQLGCTMADLTAEQKHAVSHRGKVLRMLGDHLQSSGLA